MTVGLHVDRLRLVSGISMGGMHAWLWGEQHAEMVDNLFPLVCMPTAISGVNRLWRDMAIYLITSDPDYQHGNYSSQQGLKKAITMFELVMDSASLVQSNAPDEMSTPSSKSGWATPVQIEMPPILSMPGCFA